MKKFVLLFAVTLLLYMKADAQQLVEVASFGRNQPIGVSVSPVSNRLFVSFPKHEPYLYGLTEIVNGKRKAFPNQEWNNVDSLDTKNHFVNVQDLYADENNFLWVLDSKPSGGSSVFDDSGSSKTGQFKLLKIDLKTNHVVRIYEFDDLPKDKSGLNDLVVDTDKDLAYLSDPGLSAIVVLDLKSGKSRIVLEKDQSMVSQPNFVLKLDGINVVDEKENSFNSNVNGIALTKDNRYFYFRAINQTKLYRIATTYLADDKLSHGDLSKKIEMVAETGVCHGMIADKKGNIYLTSSPDYTVKYVSPDGKLHTLVTDKRLSWPDSFGIGTDGFLYLSCSQLNRLPKYNKGKDRTAYPYRVFKIKLP